MFGWPLFLMTCNSLGNLSSTIVQIMEGKVYPDEGHHYIRLWDLNIYPTTYWCSSRGDGGGEAAKPGLDCKGKQHQNRHGSYRALGGRLTELRYSDTCLLAPEPSRLGFREPVFPSRPWRSPELLIRTARASSANWVSLTNIMPIKHRIKVHSDIESNKKHVWV